MRRHLGVLSLVLLLPWSGGAETAVELVVDASASMGEPLEGARTRLAAVQEALTAVLLALPGNDPSLIVGLRVNGGSVPWSAPDACADSSLAVALAPASRDALLAAVEGLRPGGADLAASSLVLAAQDLAGVDGRRLVVLLTDGDTGSCPGEWAAAAAALEGSSAELWVVGGGLGEAAGAVTGKAHLEPAANSGDLAAALRRAVGSAVSLSAKPERVSVRVHRGEVPVDLEPTGLDDQEGVRRDLALTDGVLRGEAPPGVYQVALTEPGGSSWQVAGLRVSAGAASEVDVELPGAGDVRLEAPAGAVPIRSLLAVRYAGARPGTGWLTVVPFATPLGDRGVGWVRVEEREGEAPVEAPERAGAAEVRLEVEVGAGGVLLAAKTLVTVQPLDAPLTAAAEVEVGDSVPVSWHGPFAPGDCVALVPAGAGDLPPAQGCRPVLDAEPVALDALPEPGSAQVRFWSGRSARCLARSPIEVVPARPRLTAPAQVVAGEAFQVQWTWRNEPGPYDYMAVAAVGATEGDYLSFGPIAPGGVVSLRAPAEPGSYEIRYASGQGDHTLASAGLEVTVPPVSVAGPGEAMVGTRVTVTWTGPDRTGDLIAVAPAGSDAGRMLDWAYSSAGSPLTVAAPDRPGEYELRYVSGGRVLARAKLLVRPPG